MSIEEDVRELRNMFLAHLEKESAAFQGIAGFHGEMRVTMQNIQTRLDSGNDCFGETETRFQTIETRFDTIENTMSRWRGWGAALIFISTILGQGLIVGVKAIWAHFTHQ